MKLIRNIIYTILFTTFAFVAKSQELCDTLPFINCNENQIVASDTVASHLFIQKFRALKTDQDASISIVHIGDSHLQAGFFTEKIKQNLFQLYSTDTNFASPGFIFPFTIAQTNNPYYFKVNYSGNWESCKNVNTEKTCKIGLSGITVSTKDSIASFSIKMQNDRYNFPHKYFFNQIKIFHNSDSLIEVTVNEKTLQSNKGFSIVKFENLIDSIHVKINISDTSKFFELYGLILENDKSKINYHTIGANGATAQSYLKCDYFSNHLEAINPDLIIISLGTNEAYDINFSSLEHKYVLRDLILQIKSSAPNVYIILTTPNDHLKNRNLYNPNIISVRKNILEICDELQLSSWDFHSIMGGEHSIKDWYDNELTGEDLLHFKRIGYEIQADLFTKALIQIIEKKEIK